MKQYELREDEVCLCETKAYEENTDKYYDIMLTNINFVMLHTKQRLFKHDECTLTIYPINDVKFYNDEPYVKLSKRVVEIYFKTCQLKFNFVNNPGDSSKLYNEFITLLTGKSIAERRSDKFKDTVKIVDNTLGVDTLGAAKNVIENGVNSTILGGTKNASAQANMPKGKLGLLSNALGVAKDIFSLKNGKKEEESTKTLDEKVDTLKKLKELVDMGIITQEEYELKKKQIFEI